MHKIKPFSFSIAGIHQLSVKQNMGHNTDADFSYEKQGKRMTLKNPPNGEICKINGFS